MSCVWVTIYRIYRACIHPSLQLQKSRQKRTQHDNNHVHFPTIMCVYCMILRKPTTYTQPRTKSINMNAFYRARTYTTFVFVWWSVTRELEHITRTLAHTPYVRTPTGSRSRRVWKKKNVKIISHCPINAHSLSQGNAHTATSSPRTGVQ